jgi:CRP-like cAMP-binding protein
MKKVMEKTRRNNIERLLNTKLFYGVNYHTFDTKLYNYFIFTKERKGDYMFKRGDKRTTLYYIKKGEIQLEINATCKQLDDIIILIGGSPENRILNNLIKTNEKLMEFINIPKKFNISIYSQGDIIGTDELIYLNSNKLNIEQIYTNLVDLNNISNSFSYNNEFENSFLFNGIYMTNCDIFKVDLHFLKNMINDNPLIKDNYEKMTRNKRERLIERLLTIKTNTILQYYNLINHKKNINYLNNISNEFNSKNNLLFLLNKKKVTNNNQLFLRKNICINESQFKNENNKINPQSPLNSNSRNTYFYGNKYKTKELFYPEPINNKLNSESNYMNERALLTSYMNNNKVKVKFDRKLFLKENSSLHKIKSEGMLLLSKNKMINDYNSFQNKMSLVKNNFKMRNTLANFIDNSNSNNEDNLSKNNSSDKMSTYKSNKSFFPNKKLKKIRNDILPNNLKIQTLKIINNKRIPKLLIKNALIYSEAIDKLLIKEQKKNIFKNTLLKNKNKNNINFIDKYKKNKIFNTLDVLVFDDILNNIKNDRFQNTKKNSPIYGGTKYRNKFKINPLHRATSYLLMKNNNIS